MAIRTSEVVRKDVGTSAIPVLGSAFKASRDVANAKIQQAATTLPSTTWLSDGLSASSFVVLIRLPLSSSAGVDLPLSTFDSKIMTDETNHTRHRLVGQCHICSSYFQIAMSNHYGKHDLSVTGDDKSERERFEPMCNLRPAKCSMNEEQTLQVSPSQSRNVFECADLEQRLAILPFHNTGNANVPAMPAMPFAHVLTHCMSGVDLDNPAVLFSKFLFMKNHDGTFPNKPQIVCYVDWPDEKANLRVVVVTGLRYMQKVKDGKDRSMTIYYHPVFRLEWNSGSSVDYITSQQLVRMRMLWYCPVFYEFLESAKQKTDCDDAEDEAKQICDAVSSLTLT